MEQKEDDVVVEDVKDEDDDVDDDEDDDNADGIIYSLDLIHFVDVLVLVMISNRLFIYLFIN